MKGKLMLLFSAHYILQWNNLVIFGVIKVAGSQS